MSAGLDTIGTPLRALLVLILAAAATPAYAADGERLYADECGGCHSLDAASTADGPSLKGLVWRRVAGLPDFTYTSALKSIGGSWSPGRLDEFLKGAQVLAPGSSMYFTIEDPAERKAIIAYLKSVK